MAGEKFGANALDLPFPVTAVEADQEAVSSGLRVLLREYVLIPVSSPSKRTPSARSFPGFRGRDVSDLCKNIPQGYTLVPKFHISALYVHVAFKRTSGAQNGWVEYHGSEGSGMLPKTAEQVTDLNKSYPFLTRPKSGRD